MSTFNAKLAFICGFLCAFGCIPIVEENSRKVKPQQKIPQPFVVEETLREQPEFIEGDIDRTVYVAENLGLRKDSFDLRRDGVKKKLRKLQIDLKTLPADTAYLDVFFKKAEGGFFLQKNPPVRKKSLKKRDVDALAPKHSKPRKPPFKRQSSLPKQKLRHKVEVPQSPPSRHSSRHFTTDDLSPITPVKIKGEGELKTPRSPSPEEGFDNALIRVAKDSKGRPIQAEYAKELPKLAEQFDQMRLARVEEVFKKAELAFNQQVAQRTTSIFEKPGQMFESVTIGTGSASVVDHLAFPSRKSSLAIGDDAGNWGRNADIEYILQQNYSTLGNKMLPLKQTARRKSYLADQSVPAREYHKASVIAKQKSDFPEVQAEVVKVVPRKMARDEDVWPEGARFKVVMRKKSTGEETYVFSSDKLLIATGQGKPNTHPALNGMDEGLLKSMQAADSSGFGGPALVDANSFVLAHNSNTPVVAKPRKDGRKPRVVVVGGGGAAIDVVRFLHNGFYPKTGVAHKPVGDADVTWLVRSKPRGGNTRADDTIDLAKKQRYLREQSSLEGVIKNPEGEGYVAIFKVSEKGKPAQTQRVEFDQIVIATGQNNDFEFLKDIDLSAAQPIRAGKGEEKGPAIAVGVDDIPGIEFLGGAAGAMSRTFNVPGAESLVRNTGSGNLLGSASAQSRLRAFESGEAISYINVNHDFHFLGRKWLKKQGVSSDATNRFFDWLGSKKQLKENFDGVPRHEIEAYIAKDPELSNAIEIMPGEIAVIQPKGAGLENDLGRFEVPLPK